MKKIILGILLLFTSSVVANTLSEIRQSGSVRVGVFEAQPPFSKFEDGKFQGFEVTLAEGTIKRYIRWQSGQGGIRARKG